jgi:curved DNA-binding protein CbpA
LNYNKGIPRILENYYETFGVPLTANNQQIKTNYLKIARRYHPDKNPETLVLLYLLSQIGIFFLYLQCL